MQGSPDCSCAQLHQQGHAGLEAVRGVMFFDPQLMQSSINIYQNCPIIIRVDYEYYVPIMAA
jgi:hypothetical protein